MLKQEAFWTTFNEKIEQLSRIKGKPLNLAIMPAHNEEEQISMALSGLKNQTEPLDLTIVVMDNCTDNTEQVALEYSSKDFLVMTFETTNNSLKKAGALNQILSLILGRIDPETRILIMDADSALDAWFMKVAISYVMKGYGACGGVFRGKVGGGFVGMCQRNEFARYARDVARKDGETLVLTGTATVFKAACLVSVMQARADKKIPSISGKPEVYDTGALTEDNELTFALLHLGYEIIAPAECSLETDVMTTWRALWDQRRRWKRGAIENNIQYGLTKYTAKYWGLQIWSVLGVFVTLAYLITMVVAIATGSLYLRSLWLVVTVIYAIERAVTVRSRGVLQMIIGASILVEMFYDISLQLVHLKVFLQALLRTKDAKW